MAFLLLNLIDNEYFYSIRPINWLWKILFCIFGLYFSTRLSTSILFSSDISGVIICIVLNVRKAARRDKHFVAHFLAALPAPCPRRLYCCPKSLEVVFRYWSFCHSYSLYYILLFTFLLGYVYTVLS